MTLVCEVVSTCGGISVDIIHVIESLWSAGRVFYPQGGQAREAWVSHRLEEILKGNAGYVAGGMRRSATKRHLDAQTRNPVDKCAIRDFEEYWRIHEAREYERTHRSKYAGGIVPNTNKPDASGPKKKRAHLRQIK